MEENSDKKCGCKGIRTCLLCESGKAKLKSASSNKDTVLYIYCSHCNLCWPVDTVSNGKRNAPLYLGSIIVILDFLNLDEEAVAIASIDKLPWMLSQSGRKKQDFGPKVNFKKRKGKIGDFKGFPDFSESFIARFQQHKELSDFSPVELCHLDYSPDRGSAIEPHIDDSWIWGERLVTINLASSTVLTLTPANTRSCNCSSNFRNPSELSDYDSQTCNHDFSILCPKPCEKSEIYSNSVENLDSRTCSDMCSVHRMARDDASIQILLPSRSLLVLAGCARYNWYHEIKREDITSRRLAMTFRELAPHFLTNDDEKKLGEELLEIGKVFRDFTV